MSNFDTRFINFLTILLVLGLISGLTGCNDSLTHKITASPTKVQSIIGGESVLADSPFSTRVIYLALGVEKKSTPFGFTISQKGLCTASAITSRILITAAHCVRDSQPEQLYAVLTLNPWNHPLNLDEWIQIEKIKINEKFIDQGNDIGNDLALIKLSKDIPLDRVSKLADLSQINSTNLNLVAVGYGQTTAFAHPGQDNDTMSPTQIQSQQTLLHDVLKTVENFQPTNKIFQVDQGDFKGICQGDSGGPGFIFDPKKQEYFILGITSFVSIRDDEKMQRDPQNIYNTCLGKGNYTNLLVYKDWITQSLNELQ